MFYSILRLGSRRYPIPKPKCIDLGSNPGTLAPQAKTLTTPPKGQRFAIPHSLFLYKAMVDYLSTTSFQFPIAKPLFILSKTTSKRFLVRKRPQLKLILMSCHCMIYDVTRCSLKRSCLSPRR